MAITKPDTNALVVPIEPVARMLANKTAARIIAKYLGGFARIKGMKPNN